MYTAREVALINLFLTEKTVYVSDETMNHPRWLNSCWAATFKAMSREGIVTLLPRPEDVRSGRVEIAPTRPSSALTLGFMAEPYNTVDGAISLILGLTGGSTLPNYEPLPFDGPIQDDSYPSPE